VPTSRSQRVDQTANFSRRSPRSVFVRPLLVIYWQIAGKWRFGGFRAWKRPGGGPDLTCGFCVEPPAGIEPATPSLPWIGGQALCYPSSSQLTQHRERRSYGASSASGAVPGGLDCTGPSDAADHRAGRPSVDIPGHLATQSRRPHAAALLPRGVGNLPWVLPASPQGSRGLHAPQRCGPPAPPAPRSQPEL
jgi:hypothetical protein